MPPLHFSGWTAFLQLPVICHAQLLAISMVQVNKQSSLRKPPAGARTWCGEQHDRNVGVEPLAVDSGVERLRGYPAVAVGDQTTEDMLQGF